MNNEEQIADTIEMLYERLYSYNKQDLFNYGYLLESNQILCKRNDDLKQELQRKDNIINELKEELNKIVALGILSQKQIALNLLDKLKELKENKYEK